MEYVRGGKGSKSIPLVTHGLSSCVAVCYVCLWLLYGSCTFCLGMPRFLTVPHCKLMFMLAVSSRSNMEYLLCYSLPAVLLRSDTVHKVAEEAWNVDPSREASFECVCACACSFAPLLPYMYKWIFIFWLDLTITLGVSLCKHVYRGITGYNLIVIFSSFGI